MNKFKYFINSLRYLLNETGLTWGRFLKELSRALILRKKEGIAGIVRYHAEREPTKIAVICEEESINYSQLYKRAESLVSFLYMKGMKPGAKIAVMTQNCIQVPEIWTGMNLGKFSSIPLNWRLKRDEITYILSDSECGNIIYQEHLGEEVRNSSATLKNLIVIGKKQDEREVHYDEAVHYKNDKPIPETNEMPATIVYTSGTTGKPKGAFRSTSSTFMLFVTAAIYELGLRHSDVHLIVCPLYHSAPLVFMALQLIIGATQVIMPKFDAEEMLRTIEKHRVTTTFIVPFMLIEILNLPESTTKKYDISSLRVVVCAAAPLSEFHKRKFQERFGKILYEFYGATESGINTILKPDDIEKKADSVGRIFPYNKIKILDENKKEVPVNTCGEIYLSNPFLMDSYYRKEKETQENRFKNYFTVGDVGKLDKDGFLYILDRKSDMVISGGVNIYPAEIEDAILRHPGVKFAAVIGIPDERWGERLKAFVVKKDGADPSPDELENFLRERIASYKVPREWEFVHSLPMTPSGKILKRTLRDKHWENKEKKV